MDARAGDWLIELPAQGLLTCRGVQVRAFITARASPFPSIPCQLRVHARRHWLQNCTRAMLAELGRRDASQLRPWLDSLPAPASLLSSCNLPDALVPLLGSHIRESGAPCGRGGA